MFRTNRNWLPQSALRSFRFSHTIEERSARHVNLISNQIKLIGRVKYEVIEHSSGFNSFEVCTAKKGIEKLIGISHNIKSRSDITRTPFPDLNHNDLVYIAGEIAYERAKNGEKFASVPHILAQKIIRMHSIDKLDDEHLIAESVNEVKLLGQIGTEIHDGLGTGFSLKTNTALTALLKENHFSSDWHRIAVFDDNLREFVRNNLKITDRILINGEMSYKRITLEDGRSISEGRILPTRIQKLYQFDKYDELGTENTNTTVEQAN